MSELTQDGAVGTDESRACRRVCLILQLDSQGRVITLGFTPLVFVLQIAYLVADSASSMEIVSQSQVHIEHHLE